ncbi:hypothetical protein OG579_15220 [Williamsia herbipolensis]|uniref:Uncharacterized protein n=1 Tax=Williamsia herbipolensis TaxID=1603258 RepID=A0AAU4JZ96_9NOCA|nr:hypothetical protein [Williamsia herbipolensis]
MRLTAARRDNLTRDQLANQLWRINNALARHHATTEHHLTEIPITNTAAEPPFAAAEPVDQNRALTEPELATEITTVRARLARVESDIALYRRRGTINNVDDVRADHDQLRRTAAAISQAEAAAREHTTIRSDYDALRRDLVAAQNALASARRGERPAAKSRVNSLLREVQTSAQRLAAAQAQADVTAAATGVPQTVWAETNARATDAARLDQELVAALHAEDSARSRDERLAAERAQLNARLERAVAEHARRTEAPIETRRNERVTTPYLDDAPVPSAESVLDPDL